MWWKKKHWDISVFINISVNKKDQSFISLLNSGFFLYSKLVYKIFYGKLLTEQRLLNLRLWDYCQQFLIRNLTEQKIIKTRKEKMNMRLLFSLSMLKKLIPGTTVCKGVSELLLISRKSRPTCLQILLKNTNRGRFL